MRIAPKATKGRGRRYWARGQASSSNPTSMKHRAKAKAKRCPGETIVTDLPVVESSQQPANKKLPLLKERVEDFDIMDRKVVRKKNWPLMSGETTGQPVSRKRKREDSDSEADETETPEVSNTQQGSNAGNRTHGYKHGGKGIHRVPDKDVETGRKFQSKKGRSDEKRKGTEIDPYAYVPLNRAALNKRRKVSMKEHFKQLVSRK